MAKALPADLGLGLIEKIPKQDLEDILAAIRAGAKPPAEAVGFGPPALNAIEQTALGYYRARRFDEAAVLYGFILRLDAGRGSAWRGLGACSQAMRGLGAAAECYRHALEVDPKDVVSKVFLGEVLCQLGEKGAGLKLLEEVAAGAVKSPAVVPYVARAKAIVRAKGGVPPRLVLMREGKRVFDQATGALAGEGFRYDPDKPLTTGDIVANPAMKPFLSELTQVLAGGQITLARVGGFTAKELHGAYAVACRYAELGQVLEAMQIAGFLMFLDSHDARYPQLIGICLQRMKQYGPADHMYSIALALDDASPMTLVYRGEAKIMAGEVDAGLAFVRQGIEAAGAKPEHKALVDRGKVLLKQFAR